MNPTAADFVGTWRLLDYSFIHEDGVVEHPWGAEVRGYLLYSAEGYMSGNLSPARDWPSRRARLAAAFKAHDGAGALRLATRGARNTSLTRAVTRLRATRSRITSKQACFPIG